MVDGAYLARRIEKLKRAIDFLGHRFHEWIENFGFVIVWQSALSFREARLFVGQTVSPLNFVSQLLSAELLFACVDDPEIL